MLQNDKLSILGLYSNIALRLREFPQALPLGAPSDRELYLTVYSLFCSNKDTVYPETSHNMDNI